MKDYLIRYRLFWFVDLAASWQHNDNDLEMRYVNLNSAFNMDLRAYRSLFKKNRLKDPEFLDRYDEHQRS